MQKKLLLLMLTIFLGLPFMARANVPCSFVLNVLLKYDPQSKTATLKAPQFEESEFCDRGTKEYNSNFKIDLLNNKNELVVSKQVYLNTLTVLEPLRKDSSAFKENKVELSAQMRNVKFAVKKDQINHYRIYSLPDHILVGRGEIK